VVARRKTTPTVQRRLHCASVSVSVVGIVIGVIAFIILIIISYPIYSLCGTVMDADLWNDTMFEPKPMTTRSPEVTSSPSPCIVVRNETMCFRFASNVTSRRCSELGGVTVSVNSSSSSSSVAATASTTICYHTFCRDYVVNTSCFQHRSVKVQ